MLTYSHDKNSQLGKKYIYYFLNKSPRVTLQLGHTHTNIISQVQINYYKLKMHPDKYIQFLYENEDSSWERVTYHSLAP